MENHEEIVDARGLACPQPVILARRALEATDKRRITAVVDNEVARDNIVKMAESLSCSVSVEQQGKDIYIHITKPEQYSTALETHENVLFLVTADTLGRGNDDLGRLLMKNFFYALTEQGGLGKVFIFLNSGVNLTCAGSPILDYLYELQQDGAEILSCGTCLDYYGLRQKLSIGQITNMYTIVEYLQKMPRVIYL